MDVSALVENKLYLAKYFNVPFDAIDKMDFWEYELTLQKASEIAKKEEQQQKRQEQEYQSKYKTPNVPKTPNIPKIKY